MHQSNRELMRSDFDMTESVRTKSLPRSRVTWKGLIQPLTASMYIMMHISTSKVCSRFHESVRKHASKPNQQFTFCDAFYQQLVSFSSTRMAVVSEKGCCVRCAALENQSLALRNSLVTHSWQHIATGARDAKMDTNRNISANNQRQPKNMLQVR